jgi:acyl dehydratase
MGDNAHLTKIDARYLKFNYMGDVTWVRGQVTDKFERDGKGFVKIAVECVNHREEVTASANAEAQLPKR